MAFVTICPFHVEQINLFLMTPTINRERAINGLKTNELVNSECVNMREWKEKGDWVRGEREKVRVSMCVCVCLRERERERERERNEMFYNWWALWLSHELWACGKECQLIFIYLRVTETGKQLWAGVSCQVVSKISLWPRGPGFDSCCDQSISVNLEFLTF